jgi:hypothetical protein
MAAERAANASAPTTDAHGPVGLAKDIAAVLAALFGSAAGAMTLGPPSDTPALTTGCAVAISAVAWLVARTLGLRQAPDGAGPSLGAGLLTGLVVILTVCAYAVARATYTVDCAGSRHAIGTQLLPHAAAIAKEKGYTDPADILMAAGCKTRDVWTDESLLWSHIVLWVTFCVVVAAIVFPLLFLWYVRRNDTQP